MAPDVGLRHRLKYFSPNADGQCLASARGMMKSRLGPGGVWRRLDRAVIPGLPLVIHLLVAAARPCSPFSLTSIRPCP
jgi:hypothetical protein